MTRSKISFEIRKKKCLKCLLFHKSAYLAMYGKCLVNIITYLDTLNFIETKNGHILKLTLNLSIQSFSVEARNDLQVIPYNTFLVGVFRLYYVKNLAYCTSTKFH